MRIVFGNVRERPNRSLRTTPVFLCRSAWPMNLSQLWEPTGVTIPRLLIGVLNPVGMLAILGLATLGLVRRRPLWFAVGGLPTGLVPHHALFTHALNRYSRPAAGLMILAVVLGAMDVSARLSARVRSRGPLQLPSGER